MCVVCGLIFLFLHSAAFHSLFPCLWSCDSKWNLRKVIGSDWVHGLWFILFRIVIFSNIFSGFIFICWFHSHRSHSRAHFFLCALFVCHIHNRPLALENPIWVNAIVYRIKYGCNLHYGYDSRAYWMLFNVSINCSKFDEKKMVDARMLIIFYVKQIFKYDHRKPTFLILHTFALSRQDKHFQFSNCFQFFVSSFASIGTLEKKQSQYLFATAGRRKSKHISEIRIDK